jgi:hypothetical protein
MNTLKAKKKKQKKKNYFLDNVLQDIINPKNITTKLIIAMNFLPIMTSM